MSHNPFKGKGYKFGIVRQRGSPVEVTLDSGHVVKKEKWLYIKAATTGFADPNKEQWEHYEAADYHGEHFLYVDPLYHVDGPEGTGHVAIMCTCGSPGIIVGATSGRLEDSDRTKKLAVCYVYHTTLETYGTGMHADQQGRRKWT